MSTKKITFTAEPWQIDNDEGALRNFIYNGVTGQPICCVAMFDQREYDDFNKGVAEKPDYHTERFDELEGNSFLLLNALRMYKLLKKIQGKHSFGDVIDGEIDMVLNSIENHIDDGRKITE